MAENYPVIKVIDDGQNAKNKNIPKKKYRIEYQNDLIYIDPGTDLCWYEINTSPVRCGTFILTAANEESLPGQSYTVVVYQKVGWSMNLVGEFAMDQKNELLLDLIYNQTYYIQYHWSSGKCITNHSINYYYNKVTMMDVAIWAKETPSNCYHYYEYTPRIPSVSMYTQVIYLDKGQVPNFISVFYEVSARINETNFKPVITLKDVITTLISAGISEVVGGGVFTGIVVSLLVTGNANALELNIKNDNGSVFEQISHFKDEHVNKQIRETNTNTVTDVSDVGMKISIKYREIAYPQQTVTFYVDDSLIEVWSKYTRVSRTVEGPKYYKGKFTTDDKLLGKNIGFNARLLKDVFGIE